MRILVDPKDKARRVDDADDTEVCDGCTDVFNVKDLEEYNVKMLCMTCFDHAIDCEEEEEGARGA